jgi:hypothetical protein
MSSTIIYRQFAVHVPAAIADTAEDQFMLIELSGCSRTYESGSRRRVRDWQIGSAGTRQEVMARAIVDSLSFEGGMVHWSNYQGYIRPEEYIRKVRRQLSRPLVLNSDNWTVDATFGSIALGIRTNDYGHLPMCLSEFQARYHDLLQRPAARWDKFKVVGPRL